MAEQSETNSATPSAITAGVIGIIALALVFVPYGMTAKSDDLARMCEGNFLHGLGLGLGWAIAGGLAIAILLGGTITAVVRRSWNPVILGGIIALAAPVSFAVGVALVSVGGPSCP